MLKRLLLTIIIFVIGCCNTVFAEDYPAQCRVTAQTLNIRSGPGKSYYKLGEFNEGDIIVVKSITQNGSTTWGCIDFTTVQEGYVAMRYVDYIGAIQETHSEPAQAEKSSGFFDSLDSIFDGLGSFLSGLLTIVKWGVIIFIGFLVFAFREQIFQAAVFLGMFTGIGALLFWILFDNSSLGATIGFIAGVLIGLRVFLQSIDGDFFSLFLLAYWLITIPSWICNRLQFVLTGPWRYLFKYTSVDDSTREVLRPFFYVLQLILYIATTPLRTLNAIYYNIFVYGITEIYDLTCEVFLPSNYSEGRGDFWKWIIYFPVRLVRYPVFHGTLVLIEGAVWTVIDIIIPTITMYHGTNIEAANAILGSSERNQNLWNQWLSGTFMASNSNNAWGGMGVYFAPSRLVAKSYSKRANGSIIIACRVSLGKILNYALAPRYVEVNTGGNGRPSVLNNYAESNGYDTAEWWNGSYWEYCLFDWQNRYNKPWRIRPIYALNVNTGLAQHIDGGFRHWLFSKMIFDDILNSGRFTALVTFAFFVVICCVIWLATNWHYLPLP